MLPAFITFTGVDAHTSIEGMMTLAADYPVEFGFVLSPARQGTGRCAPLAFIGEVRAAHGGRLKLAAHLCDGYCEALVEHGACGLEVTGDLAGYARIQVNTEDPRADVGRIAAWAQALGSRPILQCQGAFPDDARVQWLYDPSKGKGLRPDAWPAAPGEREVGYAGGLGPENAAEVCAQLGRVARNYWIDMASGVRNAENQFDLGKCRAVCEAVYGEAGQGARP